MLNQGPPPGYNTHHSDGMHNATSGQGFGLMGSSHQENPGGRMGMSQQRQHHHHHHHPGNHPPRQSQMGRYNSIPGGSIGGGIFTAGQGAASRFDGDGGLVGTSWDRDIRKKRESKGISKRSLLLC